MAELTAGQDFTVLNPIIYWAFRGATPPGMNVEYEGDWGSDWFEIRDTVNGLQATCRNPKTAVTGERFGRLGQLPSGDDGVAIAIQNLTPEMDFLQLISSMMKKEIAAVPADPSATPPTPAMPAFTSRYLSKNAENQFMLGFEGIAMAGGLFAEDTLIRAIAWRVENTANADHVWRWTGADATVRPNATLECLPENPTGFNLDGSGIPMEAVDPARKFNYFDRLIA